MTKNKSGLVAGTFVALVLVMLTAFGGLNLISTILIESIWAVAWFLAAFLCGRFFLKMFKINCLDPVLAFCTSATVGFGFMGLAVLALGMAGCLNHWTAIVLLLLMALPGLYIPKPGTWKGEPAILILTPFVAIAFAGAMIPPGILWKSADDPHPYDVVEYHLQVPREWYEAGKITPLAHNVFSYFPFGTEMHFLLAMELRDGPWQGMYLAQLMSAIFMIVAATAVFAVCRSAGGSGTLGTLAFVTAPWVPMLASVAYVESAMLMYTALALAWAMLAIGDKTDRARPMLIAGVMSGLACGTKYTAIPMVMIAIAIGALVVRDRRMKVAIAIMLASAALTFSPWLIRNTLWTGNPVFPEAMPLLGHGHFTPIQVQRWDQAHVPRPDQKSLPARLRAAADQIIADWRYGYALLPLAAIAFALSRRDPKAQFLAVVVLLTAGIWLLATHLQSRFFVSAIPPLAMLIGIAPWKKASPAVWSLLILAAAVSLINLFPHIRPYASLAGITDLKEAMPEPYRKLADQNKNIGLVGNAQAFWCQIPMTHLRYRTVFDVDIKTNLVTDWLGPKTGEWLLVYPSELERFAATYVGIPDPPQDLLNRSEPLVIPPDHAD